MRKMLMALALLAVATPLFASSPFAGTWKLNAAKSKYTTGAPPTNVTIVIEEQGTNLQVTATGANADGSPISTTYTVPTMGGTGTVESGSAFDGITVKRISDHARENTYTKGGAQLMTRHMTVSDDGKTMKSVVSGTNAKGEKIAGVDMFDKQ